MKVYDNANSSGSMRGRRATLAIGAAIGVLIDALVFYILYQRFGYRR